MIPRASFRAVVASASLSDKLPRVLPERGEASTPGWLAGLPRKNSLFAKYAISRRKITPPGKLDTLRREAVSLDVRRPRDNLGIKGIKYYFVFVYRVHRQVK